MHPLVIIALALSPILYYLYLFRVAYYKRKNDPHELPGPTLLPIIGRIHDLPIEYMWEKFEEWSHKYGPIYRTEMLGTNFIIIGNEKIAEDLLVKRGKHNSDRPEMKSLFDSKSTTGTMEYLPLMGRNIYWARGRKLSHSYLIQGHNAHYYGFMEYEVKRWMYRLLTEPENFHDTLEDMAAKIMCHLVWDDESHSTELAPLAWGLLTQISPAGPITNVITPLWDYLPEPINPWKLAERKRHDKQQSFFMDRLLEVRRETAAGMARPSFTKQYLDSADKTPLSGDYEASSCLGMLALVGVFTIGGPLNYFLQAMVYNPEVQKRAQAEIDKELGGRTPTLADMPRLPYLRACIKETMRWRPNVPTGVAHEAEKDDYYEGYFIAKGSRLLPLDCLFLKDPTTYPDPHSFRPERWVEPGWPTYREPLTKFPTIKNMSSFGWGQRQCLGMNLTQDELFVSFGGLVANFNMLKALDAEGKEIDLPLDQFVSLLITKPKPFKMRFEVRSEKTRERIVSEWEAAEQAFISKREADREAGRRARSDTIKRADRILDEKLGAAAVQVSPLVDVAA